MAITCGRRRLNMSFTQSADLFGRIVKVADEEVLITDVLFFTLSSCQHREIERTVIKKLLVRRERFVGIYICRHL